MDARRLVVSRGLNMKRMMIIIVALSALTACATVEGIGQDISAGARKTSEIF